MYILVASILFFTKTHGQTVECDDQAQCLNDNIDTTSEVQCFGFDACDSATIRTTAALYCYGYEGCSQTNYLYGNPVECNGFQGCFMAAEIESSTEIACGGLNSCFLADSLTAPEVSCDGIRSCMWVRSIVAETSISTSSAMGIYNASSVVTTTLECGGTVSCAKIRTISASVIVSAGIAALHLSRIDSNGLDTIEVSSLGLMSGYQGSIYCREGSQCNIICEGTGCYELYIYYEGSASQLTLDPLVCKLPKNRGEQIADKTWATWCPFIVSATEMTVAQFEEMKEERMRTVVPMGELQTDAVAVMKKTMADGAEYLKRIREKSLEYQSEYAVSEKLAYVSWSPDNLWIVGAVLALFMVFACYYAYRKDKEYDMIV